VLFVAGTPLYRKPLFEKKASDSLCWEMVCAVVRASTKSLRGAASLAGWLLTFVFGILFFWQSFIIKKDHPHLKKYVTIACILVVFLQFACLIWAHSNNDFIKVPADTAVSERDVRLGFQSVPVLLICGLAFYVPFRLAGYNYGLQACQMDLRVRGHQWASSFFGSLGSQLAMVIGIAVLETLVYPAIRRCRGRDLSLAGKLVIGIIVISLGFLLALILEVIRKNASVLAPPGWSPDASAAVRFPDVHFDSVHTAADLSDFMGQCKIPGVEDNRDWCSVCKPLGAAQSMDNTDVSVGIYASDISAFWILVPFFFLGAGEAMVYPSLQYYVYQHTPPAARSTLSGMFIVFGTGMYPIVVSSLVYSMFPHALVDDLNRSQIQIFYYASLLFCCVGVFLALLVLRRMDLEVCEDVVDTGAEGLLDISQPAQASVE